MEFKIADLAYWWWNGFSTSYKLQPIIASSFLFIIDSGTDDNEGILMINAQCPLKFVILDWPY